MLLDFYQSCFSTSRFEMRFPNCLETIVSLLNLNSNSWTLLITIFLRVTLTNSIPTADSYYSIVRSGVNALAVAAKLPLRMMYSTLPQLLTGLLSVHFISSVSNITITTNSISPALLTSFHLALNTPQGQLYLLRKKQQLFLEVFHNNCMTCRYKAVYFKVALL